MNQDEPNTNFEMSSYPKSKIQDGKNWKNINIVTDFTYIS